jgi:serine/threonine protein kinase
MKQSSVSTGMIVGTPLYLAPEAFEGISTIEADLWSCGVLLCVMLTGSYPYVGNNFSELRETIQDNHEIKMSQHLWSHVTDEGKDLVKKLMTLDPKSRITAKDALDHPWFNRFCPAITLKHHLKKESALG